MGPPKNKFKYFEVQFRCTEIDLSASLMTLEGNDNEKTCDHGIRYCNKEKRVHKWIRPEGKIVTGLDGKWSAQKPHVTSCPGKMFMLVFPLVSLRHM